MSEAQSRILIVDGDQDALAGMSSALREHPHAATTARSGREARLRLSKQPFALVLAASHLPDMSGFDVLQEAQEINPTTVGFILTPGSSRDCAADAMHGPAFGYLPKNPSPDILRAAIRRGLDHHALKRALAQKAEQLDRLEKALDDKYQLIQNVSHEIKNPLTVVYGYTAFLINQPPEACKPEGLRQSLQAILRNAERLNVLMDELHEYSRLTGKKITLERVPVSASSLAAEAVDNVRFDALKREIDVKLELPAGEELIVDADPVRIQQVLVNLLTNALKFTGEGGSIAVSVGKGEGFARFCVADTGVGINPQDLPRVFERFFQAEESCKKHRGLGLGLEICKNLVELHGGRIWVESKKGDGSSFYFTLPLSTVEISAGRP